MFRPINIAAHSVRVRSQGVRARRVVGGGQPRAEPRQLVHLGALLLPGIGSLDKLNSDLAQFYA